MKNGHQRIVEELLGVKDESATCDDEDEDKRGTCTEEEKVPVQKVINNYHVHMLYETYNMLSPLLLLIL